MCEPEKWLSALSLVTDEMIQIQVDKMLAMDEDTLNHQIYMMGRFGKPQLCERIFSRFLQQKYGKEA